MKQRSIKQKVELTGIGLHKGVPVTIILEPLEPDSGIVFYRSDLGISIPLTPEYIIDTTMATVIGKGDARISTIEHLMSAVYAYGMVMRKIRISTWGGPIMEAAT